MHMGRQPRIRENRTRTLNTSESLMTSGRTTTPALRHVWGHTAPLQPPTGTHPHPLLPSHTPDREKRPGQQTWALKAAPSGGASGIQDGEGTTDTCGSAGAEVPGWCGPIPSSIGGQDLSHTAAGRPPPGRRAAATSALRSFVASGSTRSTRHPPGVHPTTARDVPYGRRRMTGWTPTTLPPYAENPHQRDPQVRSPQEHTHTPTRPCIPQTRSTHLGTMSDPGEDAPPIRRQGGEPEQTE